MSSILIALMIFIMVLATTLTPYAALLAYEWTSYLPVGQMSYGPLAGIKYPKFTAAIVIIAFAVSQRDKFSKVGPAAFLIAAYAVWVTITSYFTAVADPSWVMVKWDNAVKTIIMAWFLYMMTDSRARMEAFLSLYAIALSYWIVAGAWQTIVSGGGYGSVAAGGGYLLADGSVLTIATIIACCAVYWISKYTVLAPPGFKKFYPLLAYGFMALSVIMIIGTQARTGLVAGVAAFAWYLVKAKKKGPPIALAGLAAVLIFSFAPAEWFERMSTIFADSEGNREGSSAGRVMAWLWGWNYVLENPVFGGGFRVYYALHVVTMENGVTRIIDSHSWFFEILVEQGFVGMAIFASLCASAGFGLFGVEQRLKGDPEYEWARDLSRFLQIGLVGLLIGGLFVGIGHFAIMWDMLAICAALPRVVALEKKRATQRIGAVEAEPSKSPSRVRTLGGLGTPGVAARSR
ncbi:MAG: putative O-glycosylation ligase, exosortase A system-associated [Pseudomonadota bacterium]